MSLMQIEEKPPGTAPFDTPFAWIGGESSIKALVERFYDLMDLEPGYTALRAAHGSTLENARQRLFWFLCGWMGGPQHYTDRFGHPKLRMRHMPQQTGGGSIGIAERDQWLACMDQAMGESGVDEALRARLNASFFQTADWMRNRGE
jgi:hemoglobin